jgi:hypothetical protein
MLGQKRLDTRCFAPAPVVADRTSPPFSTLGRHCLDENGDELRACVTRHGHAQCLDFAPAQCNAQLPRSVALVFKCLTLDGLRREQRFVARAIKHFRALPVNPIFHRLHRGTRIQVDDIGCHHFKPPIGGHLAFVQPVRSWIVFTAGAQRRQQRHTALYDPLAPGPVCDAVLRLAPERIIWHSRRHEPQVLADSTSRMPATNSPQATARKARRAGCGIARIPPQSIRHCRTQGPRHAAVSAPLRTADRPPSGWLRRVAINLSCTVSLTLLAHAASWSVQFRRFNGLGGTKK